MTTVAMPGFGQGNVKTGYRKLKGYSASRQAYDKRRRQTRKTPEDRAYMRIVRADVCSYCMGRCGQMAYDHIVPLNADTPGEDHWTNYTGAGRPCNAAKRDTPLLLFLLSRRP